MGSSALDVKCETFHNENYWKSEENMPLRRTSSNSGGEIAYFKLLTMGREC